MSDVHLKLSKVHRHYGEGERMLRSTLNASSEAKNILCRHSVCSDDAGNRWLSFGQRTSFVYNDRVDGFEPFKRFRVLD